jgi:hypothetical protein
MITTLNWSHDKAQQVLVESLRKRDSKDKMQTEFVAGSGRKRLDPDYKAKAVALAELYGKPATWETVIAFRKSPAYLKYNVEWIAERIAEQKKP